MSPDQADLESLRDSLAQLEGRLAEESERARAAERRLAVQQALVDNRLLQVENNRIFTAWRSVASRLLQWRSRFAERNPRFHELEALRADYAVWVAQEQAGLPPRHLVLEACASWAFRPTVTIVMRSGGQDEDFSTLQSVGSQLYSDWEICIQPESVPAAERAGIPRQRMRLIAAAFPNNISTASGDYLFFVDPGDLLSPYALYYLVEALQLRAFALVYSDEDLHHFGTRIQPELKPDWSPHLLLSCMYVGRSFLIAKTSLVRCLEAGIEERDAWRHHLLLQLAYMDPAVHHVPRVLYHRSMPPARNLATQPVAPGMDTAAHQIHSSPTAGGDITAIICSRSPDLISKCLQSLKVTGGTAIRDVVVVAHEQPGPNLKLRKAIEGGGAQVLPFQGPFNFALMNNLAAERVKSRYVLFLNDDVTAREPGWIERLITHLESQSIGIAGAILWYPFGVLQHAGIVSGSGDGVTHIGRYMRSSALWPWLLQTREVSAVTGACLAMRTELFLSLGGFDTGFPNNYNDVDLCFRARAAGRTVLCVATSGLIHSECGTRRGIVRFEERYRFFGKWGSILSHADPFYSPSLAATERIQLDLKDKSSLQSLFRTA